MITDRQAVAQARGSAHASDIHTLVTGRRVIWVVLSVAALLPFVAVEFPPLFDYYHWLFQAHILKTLVLGGTAGLQSVDPLYSLNWAPIPNLAAPVVIALLSVWLPLSIAGRVFLVLCVLLFAYGFAHMVR